MTTNAEPLNTPNAELAYRVLDHIDAHPELWNQGVYIGKTDCGTVACFAGWACLLSGDNPYFNADTSTQTDLLTNGWIVSGRAEQLLRANRWVREGEQDEWDLFDQYNSRENLGWLVAEVFGPRPAVQA